MLDDLARENKILLRNFELLRVDLGEVQSGWQLLINGDRIEALERGIITAQGAVEIDLGGRTLMPGLIDCHVHIHREILPPTPTMLPSLITAYASEVLQDMLMRGFTTVRDAGGADAGHRMAVELGLFKGPRLFVAGRAISQTGGHGDHRSPADLVDPCGCTHLAHGLGRIADGISEVRRAVRDEIRLGANQIKVMAGGGVSSLSDPIDQLQYSTGELEAIVDEATRSHLYVMAHVYTAPGIARCVEAGVRTIEHGNLLDEKTARLMAAAGTYLVPNLITYKNARENGVKIGYAPASMKKLEWVLEGGPRSIEIASAAGVKIGYGSDMSRSHQLTSEEFRMRADLQPHIDIIRSATTIGAEIVRRVGELGIIRPGAIADLIAVDGNPLEDICILAGRGERIPFVLANGQIAKSYL